MEKVEILVIDCHPSSKNYSNLWACQATKSMSRALSWCFGQWNQPKLTVVFCHLHWHQIQFQKAFCIELLSQRDINSSSRMGDKKKFLVQLVQICNQVWRIWLCIHRHQTKPTRQGISQKMIQQWCRLLASQGDKLYPKIIKSWLATAWLRRIRRQRNDLRSYLPCTVKKVVLLGQVRPRHF